MDKSPLYRLIWTAIEARANCLKSGNCKWRDIWESRLDKASDFLPSGGGFDSGSKVIVPDSVKGKEQFQIQTAFRHMNDCGMYDGWTEHIVTVRPSFSGFSISVSGKGRNGIKEYIAESFHHALNESLEWDSLSKEESNHEQ